MTFSRWVPVLFALMLIQAATGFGQEVPHEPLADRIADGAEAMIVLNDNDVVIDDISRLLTDVGFEDFNPMTEGYLDIDRTTGLSGQAGRIIYMGNQPYRNAEEVRVADREKFLSFLGDTDRKPIVEAEAFVLNSDKRQLNILGGLFGNSGTRGMVSGRRFLTFGNDEDEAFAKKILTAPSLAKKLDETSREIINQAGISFIGQASKEDVADFADPRWLMEAYADQLTDAEQQWLAELADVAVASRIGLIGLKYHQQDLQLRSRVLFGDDKTMDRLVDFSKTERDWQPDLGFEVDQLVLSASIQMEAFRSSAAARVVPQIVLQESGRTRNFEFLRGNMLRILAELSGDSWNDLSAARVGLYQNDAAENAGQLAIIGIADARVPEDVLKELRRLSRLTSPEALSVKAAEREDELLRLVDELASDDYNVSDRAETRLVLAGKAAVPALEKGAATRNENLRERSERILKRIRAKSGAAGMDVVDPGFWTTLNPGLRLEESTGQVADFTAHTIHVTPDPSKNKEEVAEAIGVMKELFGDRWGSIQVIQIRDHFVFMIGSDNDMLKRIVKNVDAGTSALTEPFRKAELTPVHGQIQVCVNTTRIMNLAGVQNWQGKRKELDVVPGVCWLGLDFDQRAASVDVLVPVKQVIPFFQMGMGF